jgi:hypothetical protein
VTRDSALKQLQALGKIKLSPKEALETLQEHEDRQKAFFGYIQALLQMVRSEGGGPGPKEGEPR